jgi:Flp pilus assembly protein TadB
VTIDHRGGRIGVVARDRKPEPVLITDVPEDPERELRRREIRYVAMMLLRAVCLIGAAVIVSTKPPLWGLWLVLCIIAMILLPWWAVILANDRPAKKRQRATPPTPAQSSQPALPSPRDLRVIDHDSDSH